MSDLFKQCIEKTLDTLIPDHSSLFSSLYEGSRYALLAPAKRIRPLLTLHTAEMLQKGSFELALIPACALEMVHTYSLIHDDLPCMDDDDFRRGRPTLHRVYTEGHAVLMGDYLLTYAFEVIATAPLLEAEQKIALVRILANAAGSDGMIGGQVMDIENAPDVEQMHIRKTAALFKAAVEFGGIIASASSQILAVISSFGIQFGKLFQAVDDILDSDHPLGQDKAHETAERLYQSLLNLLAGLPYDTTSLKKLTELVFFQCKHEGNVGNASFSL